MSQPSSMTARHRSLKPRHACSGLSLVQLLLVVALVGVAAGAGYLLNAQKQRHEGELARLREENQELQKLRDENKSLKRLGNQSQELERLRQDNAELHALRNEVKQLRDQKKQFTTTSNEVAQLRATVKQQTQHQQQVAAENQQLRAQSQYLQQQAQGFQQQPGVAGQRPPGLPGQPQYGVAGQTQGGTADPQQTEALRNVCIANLKQLDGAIQQWALERKMTANTLVDLNGIRPYLRGQRIPACPAGGSYSFTTVGSQPRCSVPGHQF